MKRKRRKLSSKYEHVFYLHDPKFKYSEIRIFKALITLSREPTARISIV